MAADYGRLQRELRIAEPQQALGHARPEEAGRRGPAAGHGPRRARADREQPARRDGSGLGYATPAGLESASRLLLDLRLRTKRPARAGRRLRPDHSGDERHHERHRRARCAASEMRRAAGRLRGRPVRRLRHRRGPAQGGRCRGSRHASGRAHARRHARHRGPADLRILRQRPRPGAPRLGPSAQRAVPGLSQRRRLLRHGRRQQRALAIGLRNRRPHGPARRSSASPRPPRVQSTRMRCW